MGQGLSYALDRSAKDSEWRLRRRHHIEDFKRPDFMNAVSRGDLLTALHRYERMMIAPETDADALAQAQAARVRHRRVAQWAVHGIGDADLRVRPKGAMPSDR